MHAQQLSLELTPSLNSFGYNITCFGMQDGVIDLTINNGVGPYTIIWSNGATTEDLTGLAAGYYRVSVIDQSTNLGASSGITLSEPEAIFTAVHLFSSNYPNGFNVSCSNCYDGSIATSVEAGIAPFTFEWNDGASTQDRAAIHAGVYLVTVTGANGCAITEQIILTAPEREDWTAFGNSGSNPGIHFMGTIDNQDLVLKTNSVERLRLKSNGDIKLSGLSGSGTRLLFADQNGIIRNKKILLPNDVLPILCDDINPLVFAFKQSPVVPAYIYSCWQRLGLGTDNPQASLHVMGGVKFSWYNDYTKSLDLGHDGANGVISTTYGHLLLNYYNGKDVVIGGGSPNIISGKLISNGDFIADKDARINGNVGIGTDFAKEKLQISSNLFLGPAQGDQGVIGWSTSYVGFNFFRQPNANPLLNSWVTSSDGINNGGAAIWGTIGGDLNFATTPTTQPSSISGVVFESAMTNHVRIRLNSGGQIGLGTTDIPIDTKVNIKGTENTILNVESENTFNTNPMYVIRSVVNKNIMKGLAVSNTSITSTNYPNGEDVFRVWGDGLVEAKRLKISQTIWSDFVFDENHTLLPLEKLETYIKVNRHLPNIPTNEDVQQSGIDVGDIQAKLLEKVEELTLYIIQLKKQNELMTIEITNLKNK